MLIEAKNNRMIAIAKTGARLHITCLQDTTLLNYATAKGDVPASDLR